MLSRLEGVLFYKEFGREGWMEIRFVIHALAYFCMIIFRMNSWGPEVSLFYFCITYNILMEGG